MSSISACVSDCQAMDCLCWVECECVPFGNVFLPLRWIRTALGPLSVACCGLKYFWEWEWLWSSFLCLLYQLQMILRLGYQMFNWVKHCFVSPTKCICFGRNEEIWFVRVCVRLILCVCALFLCSNTKSVQLKAHIVKWKRMLISLTSNGIIMRDND